MGTTVVTLKLNQNQKIWVKALFYDTDSLAGINDQGELYSWFSVTLLNTIT